MTIDNLHQLRQWQPPYRPDAIIEEGILLPGTVMMTFGAAGTWKTMNSMHLAFCISRGEPWFGLSTMPATVYLHQVELPKLLARDRVIKYATGQNTLPNLFFKTPDDDVLLDTTWGLQSLSKDIEEVRRRTADPSLSTVVILDPLYLHMQGHISDEFEVKKFQRNINSLRKKYDVSFIIVHHSRLTRVDSEGKVVDLGAEEIMGSSMWNNWLDTIIRIKLCNPYSGSNICQFTFDKTRNAQRFLPGFKVRWCRDTLYPEVIARDIVEEEEPTVRGELL